jgi:hypothetical protein
MDNRKLELCRALRNVVDVVKAHPSLLAAAGESRAFELFVTDVEALAAIHEEQVSSRAELSALRDEKGMLVENINRALESLESTAEFIAMDELGLAPIAPLPDGASPMKFIPQAHTMVESAAKHADVFIENGLHPRAFDDARAWIERLTEADRRASYLEATARSFDDRIKYAAARVRKRQRQLYLDLERAMTDESRMALRSAAALGRVHRPALARVSEPKLLPAASSPETDAAVLGVEALSQQVDLPGSRPEAM